MNQLMIAGHLGADPEVRFTSSGQKVTTLRVAAKCRKGSKNNDDTIWWRVSVWGEQFDKMMPYLKKGSAIMVMGELNKPEMFTDKDGKSQISMSMTAMNLQFSPFGRTGGESSQSHSSEGPSPEMAYAGSQESMAGKGQMDVPFSDDEIPF